MERNAFDESIEGSCTSFGKVFGESTPANVGHVVLFGQWGDRYGGIFAGKCGIQEDEIGEAAPYSGLRLLEGLEVCLVEATKLAVVLQTLVPQTHVCSQINQRKGKPSLLLLLQGRKRMNSGCLHSAFAGRLPDIPGNHRQSLDGPC